MSSSLRTTWTPDGQIESMGSTDGHLYLYPGNLAGDQIVIAPPKNMPPEQMLAVANRVLAGVQRWRDTVAQHAERARTTADELAEARAEITRLRAETKDGDES
ncbi:hypothetical protein [Streptomyces sp.]|uniref:hypothetical protein n=1 Tax=Streptomyces sp. TaxID=1931 RepID=UPI002811A98C|nr:hypothetical protein [Streptomyces sp.]